jgi:hypothetical protein
MTLWWDRIGAAAEKPQPAPGPSVYERRDPQRPDRAERWEPVGELDPQTGQWTVPPRPGWERRAQGWVPLDERRASTSSAIRRSSNCSRL